MFGFGPRKGRRRSASQIRIDEALHRWAPALRSAARMILLAGAGGAALWGLHQAQSQADLRPLHLQRAEFELIGVPKALHHLVRAELDPLTGMAWNDPAVCHAAYARLRNNGWVRKVVRVAKGRAGQIVIDCDYRVPVALVQAGESFYLVDEYGVRLPGAYEYQPGWLLVRGLRGSPPEAGVTWPGEDAAAAVRLAGLIRRQPFARQVRALLMANYGGRSDPYASHVELETQDPPGRILWGSAPGLELEENSVAQKLHILSENYRRWGRIDANQPKIDVSVFPDRFLIPP